MVVTELIEKIRLLKNLSRPIYGSLGERSNELYYVNLFGNHNGLPSVSIYMEKPIKCKTGAILLSELENWKKESIHYEADVHVYLNCIHNYEDESYDFRFFKIRFLLDEGEQVILVAESNESIEFRDHHEAVDSSMFE